MTNEPIERPARRRRPHPARRARRVAGAVGVAAAVTMTGLMAVDAGRSAATSHQQSAALTANTTAGTTTTTTAAVQAATPSASANTTTKGS